MPSKFYQEWLQQMRQNYMPAPPMVQRYAMRLQSGEYTGMGADGRPQRMMPTQQRVAHNGAPYQVDEHELLVTDAQTLQDYGGPHALDQFIQQHRPQPGKNGMVPMYPQQPGQSMQAGNALPPERQRVPDQLSYATGGVPGDDTEERMAFADSMGGKTYSRLPSMNNSNTDESGSISEVDAVGSNGGVPPVRGDVRTAPVVAPREIDTQLMDRYLTRQGAMNAAERSAEAQTLRQQGIGREEIAGRQAIGDVSRRSALGETAAALGTQAMQADETRRADMRNISERRREFDRSMALDEQKYSDTKQWQDFLNAAEYGDDATVAAAYEKTFGRPLTDEAMVNDIRDWARRRGEAETSMTETQAKTWVERLGAEKYENIKTKIRDGASFNTVMGDLEGMGIEDEDAGEMYYHIWSMGQIERDLAGIQRDLGLENLDSVKFGNAMDKIANGATFDLVKADLEEMGIFGEAARDAYRGLRTEYALGVELGQLQVESQKLGLDAKTFDLVYGMIKSGASYESVAPYMSSLGISGADGASEDQVRSHFYSLVNFLPSSLQGQVASVAEQTGVLQRLPDETAEQHAQRIGQFLGRLGVDQNLISTFQNGLAAMGGKVARETFDNMVRLAYGKEDMMEQANLQLRAGNIDGAELILRQLYPDARINFSRLKDEQSREDFSTGMGELASIASTFTTYEDAKKAIGEAGIAKLLGMDGDEAGIQQIFEQMRLFQDPLYQWTYAIGDSTLKTVFPGMDASTARSNIAKLGAFGAISINEDGSMSVDYQLIGELFGEGFLKAGAGSNAKPTNEAWEDFLLTVPAPVLNQIGEDQLYSNWMSKNRPLTYDVYSAGGDGTGGGSNPAQVISHFDELVSKMPSSLKDLVSKLPPPFKDQVLGVLQRLPDETAEQHAQRIGQFLGRLGVEPQLIAQFTKQTSAPNQAEIDRLTGVANTAIETYKGLANDSGGLAGSTQDILAVAQGVLNGTVPKNVANNLKVNNNISEAATGLYKGMNWNDDNKWSNGWATTTVGKYNNVAKTKFSDTANTYFDQNKGKIETFPSGKSGILVSKVATPHTAYFKYIDIQTGEPFYYYLQPGDPTRSDINADAMNMGLRKTST